MINSKDLATLLSLLSEDEKPLETIATTFYRTFSKNDHFKIGCAIYTMIKDGFIKIQTHRIIGFYILFSLYKPENSIISSGSLSSSSILSSANDSSLSTNNSSSATSSDDTSILDYPIVFNPFLPLFIDEIEKQFDESSPFYNQIEKSILSSFLTNLPKDFSKKTPKEIINITKNSLSSPQNTSTTATTSPNSNTSNSSNSSTSTTYSIPIFTKSTLKEYQKFYLDRLVNHCYPSFRSIGVSSNLLSSKLTSTTATTTATNSNNNNNNNNLISNTSQSLSSTNISNSPNNTQQKLPQQQSQQQKQQQSNLKDIEVNSDQLSFFSFEPQFKRVTPPIFSPVTTIWINSSINHGLLLSNPPIITPPITNTASTTSITPSANTQPVTTTSPTTTTTTTTNISSINSKKIVRDLMTKAIKCRLKKHQLLQIKQEMESDPKLVLYSGLTPKKLPNLVENNTNVAIDALLKLIHSPDFKDYFQTLISMEMNFRSMEVVNALATSVELPSHFIPMYITNCINTCNNIKEDKAMQQRSVRLVCVFIQSLIRNNIIDIKDLFTQVQSFCLEFSKIREAINLFKFINESSF